MHEDACGCGNRASFSSRGCSIGQTKTGKPKQEAATVAMQFRKKKRKKDHPLSRSLDTTYFTRANDKTTSFSVRVPKYRFFSTPLEGDREGKPPGQLKLTDRDHRCSQILPISQPKAVQTVDRVSLASKKNNTRVDARTNITSCGCPVDEHVRYLPCAAPQPQEKHVLFLALFFAGMSGGLAIDRSAA